MSLLFGFINENKKRRLNRKKPVFKKRASKELVFRGAVAKPERIEAYKEIHRRKKAGLPMTQAYDRAAVKLGFASNSSVIIGYRLWVRAGFPDEVVS